MAQRTPIEEAAVLHTERAILANAVDSRTTLWVSLDGHPNIRWTDLSAQERLRDILRMHIAKIEDRLREIGEREK